MLTIKHIQIDRSEVVYQAPRAEFHPAEIKTYLRVPDRVCLFTDDFYLIGEMYGGVVYVMNEHGATVAKYDLGDDPTWVERAPLEDAAAPAA